MVGWFTKKYLSGLPADKRIPYNAGVFSCSTVMFQKAAINSQYLALDICDCRQKRVVG
jgi:hypothetical protein